METFLSPSQGELEVERNEHRLIVVLVNLKKISSRCLLLYRPTTNWNWKTQYRVPWRDIVIEFNMPLTFRCERNQGHGPTRVCNHLISSWNILCIFVSPENCSSNNGIKGDGHFSVTFMLCNWQIDKASWKWNFRWNTFCEWNLFLNFVNSEKLSLKVFQLEMFVGNLIFLGLHVATMWPVGLAIEKQLWWVCVWKFLDRLMVNFLLINK